MLVQWLINDGEYLPSHSWICPSTAAPMDPARADAYWIAMLTPSQFTREHAHTLFFSGGQGGRISSSFPLWDAMDREFEDLTVDQAKACSHRRLEVQGAMDLGRERTARALASYQNEPSGVIRYDLDPDSDAASAPPPPPARAARPFDVFRTMGRSSADLSLDAEDMPLVVLPPCIQEGCSREGNVGMITCVGCQGDLHRTCGTFVDQDDEASPSRQCSACTSAGKGKGPARP